MAAAQLLLQHRLIKRQVSAANSEIVVDFHDSLYQTEQSMNIP